MEIEREEELENMKEYKISYYKRRETEKENWKMLLQKEIERVKQKNKMLDLFRDRQKLKNKVFYTLQNHNIGSNYLKNLKKNTFNKIFAQGFYPNELKNHLEINFSEWLIEETSKEANALKVSYDFEDLQGKASLFNEFVVQLQETRHAVDLKREKMREKMRKRKFNDLNKNKRVIKLFYKDPNTVPTFESRFFTKYIDGDIQDYETQKATRLATLQEQLDKNEITEDEYNNIKKIEFPLYPKNNFSFYIKRLGKLGFSLAHNMYYSSFSQNHYFTMHCYFFDRTGQILYHVDKENQPKLGKIAKYKLNIRDKRLKTSDDEILIINLEEIPPEVYSFLFMVELPNYEKVLQQQSDIEYARFSLTDPEYNILFDNSVILKDYKFEDISKELDMNIESNHNQVGILMPYYVTRSYDEWHIEFIKESKVFKGKEPENFFAGLPGFIGSCSEKNQEEESLRQNLKTEEDIEDEPLTKSPKKNVKVTKPEITNNLVNRAFQNTIISIDDSLDDIYKSLIEGIEKDDPEILKTAEWGYEFLVHDKLFVRQTQIRTIKKLGELEIRKKKEPEPVKEIPLEEGQGDEGEGNESPDNKDYKIDD